MKRMKNHKGFTLIELMVVLVIIGILATLAIPKFAGAQKKSKAVECKPFLKEIYTLQEAYKIENAAYAANGTDLGFDKAPAGARYTYDNSNVATEIGYGTLTAGGATELGIAASSACITDAGAITAEAALATFLNSTTDANCGP